jgi:nitroreductase
MDVKKAIEKRKSIRRFKEKQVPNKMIKEIIDAARRAPSGCNVQPTRYFVIKDRKLKERLKQKKAFEQEFVYNAPIIIVLSGNPKDYETFGEVKRKKGLLSENDLVNYKKERVFRDISIASSFLVLKAVELGLGTCYIGLINENVIKEELKIPKEWLIPFIIIVGYPAENPEPTPRKDLDEIMKFVK